MHTIVFITALRGSLQEASLLLVYEQRGKTLHVVLYDGYDDVTSYNMARLSYAGRHWKRRRCDLVWTETCEFPYLKYQRDLLLPSSTHHLRHFSLFMRFPCPSYLFSWNTNPKRPLIVAFSDVSEWKGRFQISQAQCAWELLTASKIIAQFFNFTSNKHTSYCHDNLYKTNVEA